MPRGNAVRNRHQQNYDNRYSRRPLVQRSDFESRQKFIVYIDEGEQAQIKNWVKVKQDIETGGDLFGLWIDEKTAVVQFVLGPGNGCARTAVSFYQDIEYLRKAGSYLTQVHGLCNIGQWHSHHRLSLTKPSGGDENTVWGNMPNLGLKRYVVFIATITGYGTRLNVDINPYLFAVDQRGYRCPVAKGELMVLRGRNSPFRTNEVVVDFVEIGQEVIDSVASKIRNGKAKEIRETSKRASYTADLHMTSAKFHKIEMGFSWQMRSPTICYPVVTVKFSGSTKCTCKIFYKKDHLEDFPFQC